MSKISVIIPVYNSAKTIAKTIESIKLQEGLIEPPEIIIVNDGSSDESLRLLNTIKNITVITQNNSGPATARNKGAKIAKGNILVFTDSDTVPHKDWLKKLTTPFENKKIVATTGTYSIENKWNKLAQLIQAEIEYKHSKYGDYIAFGGTYNLAIKKELFIEIGGFNEQYKNASGEDVDICYKILNLGFKIKFVKEAIVGHYHPEKLTKYLKTQFKHGFWRAKLYFDHPNKTTGDDYTGCREILETIFAGSTIFSSIMYLFLIPFNRQRNIQLISLILHSKQSKKTRKLLLLLPIISLFFIESNFVSKLYSFQRINQQNLPSKLYASLVFSFRAIYRTLGFIKGIFFNFIKATLFNK